MVAAEPAFECRQLASWRSGLDLRERCRLAHMKRPHEPLAAEFQGLQALCAAAIAFAAGRCGGGDDVIVGALLGAFGASWLFVLAMAVAPRMAEALLRVGWAVRVSIGERVTTGASAACLRIELEAERRGWSGRARRACATSRHAIHRAAHVCVHHGPVAIARRGWAWLELAEKWRRRRIRRELEKEALAAVARLRVSEMWLRLPYHGSSARAQRETGKSKGHSIDF